jgi:RES domain-containing protein
MVLWRLVRRPYADLNGRGGELTDGRWHTRGRPVVYCAATAAFAVLEVRVHLDLPLELLPDDYVMMKIAASGDLDAQALQVSNLPPDWRESEEVCRPFGDAWLRAASVALLGVPSAIVGVERNVLLNSKHTDAARVHVEEVAPFTWDRRLFRS